MSEREPRILRTWRISTDNPLQRDIRGMFLHTGTINDLSDVAKIAHAKGKEIFRTSEDIRVLPICQPLHPVEDGYLLVVEKIGLHNQPLVGKRRGEDYEKGTSDIQRVSSSIDIGPDPSHSGHSQPHIPAA